MIFSSLTFLFTFLPITLFFYFLSPTKIKNITLLIFSLIFYAWGEPVYIFLMLFTIAFNYLLAIYIDKYKDIPKKHKLFFIITLVINILILGCFKYFGFIMENINNIFSLNIAYTKIPLPIGISFYTFQVLSYIIDIYLGKVKIQKNIFNFALYITMFPQLIAGPIVKYSIVDNQLEHREYNFNLFGYGVERFLKGLGKKVLLANNIGFLFTTISSSSFSELSVLTAWIGILAYTFQIYFDFSGYSDMAIGLGSMLGFNFPENFNYPYIAKSITEFWRRWHMTLSGWFKEYIYIPLGGNKLGVKKQVRNIFIVWVLTGLWHGASWNFIVWGLYYGVILLLEKFILKNILKKAPSFLLHTYTMLIVVIGWTFFSLESLNSSLEYLKIMFFLSGNPLIDSNAIYYLYTNIILFILLILASTPLLTKIFNKYKSDNTVLFISFQMLVFIISISYLVNETYNPFLYFRF